MQIARNFAWAAAVGLLLSPGLAAAATHALTGDNTTIEFTGSKKDGAHTGSFKKVAGTAALDGDDVTKLKLDLTIDVNSMVTDNAKLTAHLKAPDFFEVKKYPEAKFKSSNIAKTDSGYTVNGELTIRGVTKPISFPADIKASADGLTLTAKFNIDRNEWGISYGKGMINDAVAMKVAVSLKK